VTDNQEEDYITKLIDLGVERRAPIVLSATRIAQDIHKNEKEARAFEYINSMMQESIAETCQEIEKLKERLDNAKSFDALLREKFLLLEKTIEEARKTKTLVLANEISSSENILAQAEELSRLRSEKISRAGKPVLEQKLDKAHKIKKRYTIEKKKDGEHIESKGTPKEAGGHEEEAAASGE